MLTPLHAELENSFYRKMLCADTRILASIKYQAESFTYMALKMLK